MLAMVPYLRSRPPVPSSVPRLACVFRHFGRGIVQSGAPGQVVRLARGLVLSLVLVLSLALATPARAAWLDRHEAIMGTNIDVEIWHDEGPKGDVSKGNAALDAVMAEMRRIDALMSHYKPESQLSQINQRAFREPVVVDQELFDLLKLSLHFSEVTEGAFDITYASVGYLYDYRKHVKPSEGQIESALPGVNFRNLKLDAKTRSVRFGRDGMRIDLGGIAKGYAVDRGIELLQKRGVQHAVVTAGGDTRIIGDRFGRPWVVGIRHPDDKSKVVTRIPLVDTAMSTSGDYERYFDEKGVRYHHIIDPKTGHSASKVRSATILGPTAVQTDGLSKTAFILGPDKALEIIERLPDFDAIFVRPDGRVLYTKGLQPPDAPAPPGK
jgi:thiamine biosynthesis lipoprotein